MSDLVVQILEELCEASDDCIYADLRGVGDDEKNAHKNFEEVWDNAVNVLSSQPTIADFLAQQKPMLDKTKSKMVSVASLERFMRGE